MEVLVILIVPLIAFVIWAVAYFQPGTLDPIAARARLDQQVAWLEERLAQAREKNWDEQMISNLSQQLEAARRRQAA